MGKTTNELENVHGVLNKEGVVSAQSQMNAIIDAHEAIARELGINVDLRVIFESALKTANELEDIDARYDALVAAGEDASTRVLSGYLKTKNFEAKWSDARDVILTDSKHRSARVDERNIYESGTGLRNGALGNGESNHRHSGVYRSLSYREERRLWDAKGRIIQRRFSRVPSAQKKSLFGRTFQGCSMQTHVCLNTQKRSKN